MRLSFVKIVWATKSAWLTAKGPVAPPNLRNYIETIKFPSSWVIDEPRLITFSFLFFQKFKDNPLKRLLSEKKKLKRLDSRRIDLRKLFMIDFSVFNKIVFKQNSFLFLLHDHLSDYAIRPSLSFKTLGIANSNL